MFPKQRKEKEILDPWLFFASLPVVQLAVSFHQL